MDDAVKRKKSAPQNLILPPGQNRQEGGGQKEKEGESSNN